MYTPIVRYARFLSWNFDVRNARMAFIGVENGNLFLSQHHPVQILQEPSHCFLVLILHDAMRMSHTVPEKPVVCIRLLKEAIHLELGSSIAGGQPPG